MARELKYITGQQFQAARALLGWSQADLAEAAGIPVSSVSAAETGRIRNDDDQARVYVVVKALERMGILFVSGDDDMGVFIRRATADIIPLAPTRS